MVLVYVYIAVILLGAVKHVAALKSNLHRITSQIRGNLNDFMSQGNLELNPLQCGKCVEIRGFAPSNTG